MEGSFFSFIRLNILLLCVIPLALLVGLPDLAAQQTPVPEMQRRSQQVEVMVLDFDQKEARQDSLAGAYTEELSFFAEALPHVRRVTDLLEMENRTREEWEELADGFIALGEYAERAGETWLRYHGELTQMLRDMRASLTDVVVQEQSRQQEMAEQHRQNLTEMVDLGEDLHRLTAVAEAQGCDLATAGASCPEAIQLKANEVYGDRELARVNAEHLEHYLPMLEDQLQDLTGAGDALGGEAMELDRARHEMRVAQGSLATHMVLVSDVIHREMMIDRVDNLQERVQDFRSYVNQLTGQLGDMPRLLRHARASAQVSGLRTSAEEYQATLQAAAEAQAKLNGSGSR